MKSEQAETIEDSDKSLATSKRLNQEEIDERKKLCKRFICTLKNRAKSCSR